MAIAVTSGVLFMVAAIPAAAVPIVDQSFTSPTNWATSIDGSGYYLAQTFTAGKTGNLTGVNIDVSTDAEVPPLRVVIRTAPDGLPSGPALGIRYLPRNSQIPLSRLITFHTPIPVTAGGQYAIQLNYAGATGGEGSWNGAYGNVYPGGGQVSHFAIQPPGPYWVVWPEYYDLHFRTYVDPA